MKDFLRATAFAALVLAGTRAAEANGPEVGFDAGTIHPRDSQHIRLRSERVEIDLPGDEFGGDTTNASCVYVLENLSRDSLTFSMAFVGGCPISPGEPDAWSGYWQQARFAVQQDGKPVFVHYAPGRGTEFRDGYGAEADSFPVWTLTIPAHARSTVRMEYVASWSGGCDGQDCGRNFTYFTRPASRWAGTIERAEFRLRLGSGPQVRRMRRTPAPWKLEITPAGFTWDEFGPVWRYANWEPGEDLAIRIDFNEADASRSPWSPESLAAMPEPTTGLDRVPAAVERPCNDWRTGSPAADSVRVRVLVRADGRLESIRFPDPPRPLEESAEFCVRTWKFRPALQGGSPVGAWTDFIVHFPGRSPAGR